jgi:hypothetical protein
MLQKWRMRSFDNYTPAVSSKIQPSTKDEILKECNRPDRRNYVCLMMRPGFYSWIVELEYTFFKPDTDANDGFHLMLSMWPDNEPPIPALTMGVVSIDQSGQAFAESILYDHGLKAIGPNKAFILVGPHGTEQFFVHGDNTWVLENHSKGAENVVYTNDPVKLKAAWEHEQQQAQRFFDAHAAWLTTPEGEAQFKAYWDKHPEGTVI